MKLIIITKVLTKYKIASILLFSLLAVMTTSISAKAQNVAPSSAKTPDDYKYAVSPYIEERSVAKYDTVLNISGVEIKADRIFLKEDAGMKASSVDSLVMKTKINVSLSDLLAENTPIFIKSHGRGALATASFRGTAASHTQVTWNGLNINSPMTGMVDFSLIPVYIADDINIKYGTASIADNSGGIGGSINIDNTVDWNDTMSLSYMQTVGSYKTFDEFLRFGIGNKKIQSRTRIYHNYSKNDYTYINHAIVDIDPETGELTNPVDTNDNAAYKRCGILQEIYYRPSDNNILSVKYWGQAANRAIPRATSYEGPDNSNLNNQNDIDHKVILDYTHFGTKDKLTARSGYVNKHLLYTLLNHVYGAGSIPAIYSISSTNSFLNNVTYVYNFNNRFSIEGHLDGNYHNVFSQDTVKMTGYNVDRFELSAFIAVRKNFWDRLNLNLMIRQDVIAGEFIPIIPFFGFDYKVLKGHDFIIKGNIARNYHVPSLNDLYWQPGGNPDLQPEDGFSMELGTEYQYTAGRFKLTTEATVFRSNIDNWIIWIPSFRGYWEPLNITKVVSQGAEVNLGIEWVIGKVGIKASGNYSFTDARNYGDTLIWGVDSYGKQLVYIPKHSGNALIQVSYRGFHITYQHNSYSERYTTSSNDTSRRDWLYPYFMNDLFIGKDFQFKKFALSLEFKIYNLFNETYHSILYRPMPGQNYLGQITVKL